MELTASQSDKLDEIVREWRQVFLKTGPVDIESIRPAINAIYVDAGMSSPEFVNFNTPAYFDGWSDWNKNVKKALNDDKHELLLYLRCPLDSLLVREIDARLDFVSRLESLAEACVPNYRWHGGFYGSSGIAFYEFASYLGFYCRKWMKDRLNIWGRLAKNAFLWFPLRDKVVFLDFPISRWDDGDRLHCEDGPAVKFRDSMSIVFRRFYWHGVKVPIDVIMAPEKQTIQDIIAEANVEIRRIRIERLGWQRYLQETSSELLDSEKNEVEGTTESLMRSPQGKVLVCACPSTARVYALEVPQAIETCRQAQIWLSGGLSKRITAAT